MNKTQAVHNSLHSLSRRSHGGIGISDQSLRLYLDSNLGGALLEHYLVLRQVGGLRHPKSTLIARSRHMAKGMSMKLDMPSTKAGGPRATAAAVETAAIDSMAASCTRVALIMSAMALRSAMSSCKCTSKSNGWYSDASTASSQRQVTRMSGRENNAVVANMKMSATHNQYG